MTFKPREIQKWPVDFIEDADSCITPQISPISASLVEQGQELALTNSPPLSPLATLQKKGSGAGLRPFTVKGQNNLGFASMDHLCCTFFVLKLFKNVKTILNSWAIQKQTGRGLAHVVI